MGLQHLSDLSAIIEDLDAMGRLARVRSEVDPEYDLAGIAAKFEGGPRAVLFENVKGHEHPVFVGLYWSRELLGALMRMPARELPGLVSRHVKKWQVDPVAPVVIENGPVREITESDVDLTRLPIPVHALKDGGAYFSAAVVVTRDPDSGVRNASIQRFQVIDKDTLAVNIDSGRHLENYLAKAAKRGENLPFTLNVGVGPGLHFAASAPAEAAPVDKDELGIASEFHGAPVELVRSDLSQTEMIAHAMYALECELIHDQDHIEGPFAEVTGCYAEIAPRGKVKVKRIHRRRNPVFQTILSGVEVYNSVGLLGEANVLNMLQLQVPGVKDVYFSHGGCGFYGAVVQIAQTRAGWARQAILATFAAFPPLKTVTVVDDDVDIYDPSDVEWAMSTRLDPRNGVIVLNDIFGHGLNPSFPDYLGGKIGFDATQPFPHQPQFERATVKEMSLDGIDIVTGEIAAAAPTIGTGAGGGSLVDYILAKTGATPAAAASADAKNKTNGAAPPDGMNGATPPEATSSDAVPPPGGTLKDWILNQTNGSADP
jgi:UbiD family decarboxylase